MRIGIFGGTFNPPHLGHRLIGERAVHSLGLDLLYVVPSALPPHKELYSGTPPEESRLHMTAVTFTGEPQTEVSPIEIERGGRSYTVDTVLELVKRHPGAELFLILGTDMLLSFDRWHQPREILEYVQPAVFARDEGDAAVLREGIGRFEELFGAKIHILTGAPLPISSTDIRQQLPRRLGTDHLNDSVYGYIIKNRFYGARPSFPWLRQKSYAHHDTGRVPHAKGCEEEAARLALRWGADEDEAREAGILHDITKKIDAEHQLILCEKYDIITDNVEKSNYKLLHAKTGAALARDLFGVDEAVYNAILWHTTGRPKMSLLDGILYMADYIEPTREFDGVKQLRALAYSDLRAALILGLQMSIDELESTGVSPHPRTVGAIESLVQCEGLLKV